MFSGLATPANSYLSIPYVYRRHTTMDKVCLHYVSLFINLSSVFLNSSILIGLVKKQSMSYLLSLDITNC